MDGAGNESAGAVEFGGLSKCVGTNNCLDFIDGRGERIGMVLDSWRGEMYSAEGGEEGGSVVMSIVIEEMGIRGVLWEGVVFSGVRMTVWC